MISRRSRLKDWCEMELNGLCGSHCKRRRRNESAGDYFERCIAVERVRSGRNQGGVRRGARGREGRTEIGNKEHRRADIPLSRNARLSGCEEQNGDVEGEGKESGDFVYGSHTRPEGWGKREDTRVGAG